MSKLPFNFNDMVYIRPTIKAMDVLLEEHENFWYDLIDKTEYFYKIKMYEKFLSEYHVPTVSDDGFISMPLWTFMAKFGGVLFPGVNPEEYFLEYYIEHL